MVKQVIVVNMAVPMGVGQLAAQSAHAAIAVFLDKGEWPDRAQFQINDIPGDMAYWMKKSFTKIVVKEWGKERLETLRAEAQAQGLPTALIEDYGHTTALAIGPGKAHLIDPITGDLPLL